MPQSLFFLIFLSYSLHLFAQETSGTAIVSSSVNVENPLPMMELPEPEALAESEEFFSDKISATTSRNASSSSFENNRVPVTTQRPMNSITAHSHESSSLSSSNAHEINSPATGSFEGASVSLSSPNLEPTPFDVNFNKDNRANGGIFKQVHEASPFIPPDPEKAFRIFLEQ